MNKFLKNTILTLSLPILLLTSMKAFSACVSENSSVSQDLLFLIDVSGSMDSEEMELTLKAYRDAFSDEEVAHQLSYACGCTQVTAIVWADRTQFAINPTKIKSESDLKFISEFFDEQINNRSLLKNYGTGEQTFVLQALNEGYRFFQESQERYNKKTILVSGDGIDGRIGVTQRQQEYHDLQKTFYYDENITVHGVPVDVYNQMQSPEILEPSNTLGVISPYANNRSAENPPTVPEFYEQYVKTEDGFLKIAKDHNDFSEKLIEAIKDMSQCMPMS